MEADDRLWRPLKGAAEILYSVQFLLQKVKDESAI